MSRVDYVKKEVNNVAVRQRRRGLTALAVVGVILQSVNAYAAGSLGIGNPTVEANQVVFPILLGGDLENGVAAMDFRFRYNPDTLRPVSVVPGAAAMAANKRVMANLAAPGEYIVVLFGMSNSPNQTACAGGEVARVVMEKVSQEKTPQWDLSLARPTLSSVNGTPIPSHSLPYRGVNAGNKPAEEQTERPVDVSRPALPDKTPGEKPAQTPAKDAATPVTGMAMGTVDGVPMDLAAVLAKLQQAREGVQTPGVVNGAAGSNPAESDETPDGASQPGSPPGTVAETRLASNAADEDSAKPMRMSTSREISGKIDTVELDNAPKPSDVFPERGVQESSPKPQLGKVAVAVGATAVIALFVIGFLVRRTRRLG